MTEVTTRRGREGNRWYNTRPTEDEFKAWFKTVRLHEGLDHDDFVSGITLIQSTEKVDEFRGFDDNGRPQIAQDVRHLVFTPWPKAEARVMYFEAYKELHPELYADVVPYYQPGHDSKGLPPHFFQYRTERDGKQVSYVGASMRVVIFDRSSVELVQVTETGIDGNPHTRTIPQGRPVAMFPPGTKAVPFFGKYDPDHHAMSKAETGAVARALGFARMLVIPGSGVATAEDVQEALGPQAPAVEQVGVPAGAASQDDNPATLLPRIGELLVELGKHPAALSHFNDWAESRGFKSLDGLTGAQLKAVIKKAEKELDAAHARGDDIAF